MTESILLYGHGVYLHKWTKIWSKTIVGLFITAFK